MDSKKIKKQLDKICNSKEFSNSSTYSKLLRYIVTNSINGENIKEISIALEIFNETNSYDPGSDSKVRSTVHYLRRKLDSYYQNEGKDDSIRIEIPKGHYTAVIEMAGNVSKRSVKNIVIGIMSIIILALVIYHFSSSNLSYHSCINKRNIIWKNFILNKSKTTFILGDHYFYIENKDSSAVKVIRDFTINSDEDMDNFLSNDKNETLNIRKTSHTYLTKRIPWSLYYILPKISHKRNIVEMKLSSEIHLDDLNTGNIIYTGAFRSLGLLEQVIQKLPFSYDNKSGILTLNKTDDSKPIELFADECHAFQQEMKNVKDFAVVAKITNNNGHTNLLFMSTHDVGVISAVRFFTEKETLSNFIKRYGVNKQSPNFCAVFEVNGIERTDFDFNLVYFQKLN